MYNQGHQQGQNLFMNGGHGHQRFAMQMNAAKPFQANQHHQPHAQHRLPQDHAGHNHGANFANHQHNVSNSGFQNGNQHFNANPIRNGTPNHLQNGLSRPHSEHWSQQLALWQEAQEATGTHHYARIHPNKASTGTAVDLGKKEENKEYRNRPNIKEDDKEHTWDEMDLCGQGLRALSTGLFMFQFLKHLYLNNNNLTTLTPAIGQLRSLTLLDLSKNKLTELPAEIGMLVQLADLRLFDNELESIPQELGYLFNLKMLGVKGNEEFDPDIIEILQGEDGTRALVRKLQETSQKGEPPAERPWVEFDEYPLPATADTIKVFDWNTLCDMAATATQFGYTPPGALQWEFRKQEIINEIERAQADIVSLQEIDQYNFHEWFRPQLARFGYKGFYWPRSRSRTMSEKDQKRVDGCAMFYKDAKFILLDKQVIEYAHLAINRPDMKAEPDIFNRVMLRDHIAVAGFFEIRKTGARVMVGNTHLFWDHAFRDVKVIQVAILLEQFAKLADGWTKIPAVKDKTYFRHSEADKDGANDDADADGQQQQSQTDSQSYAPSQEYTSGPQIPFILCGDYNSMSNSGVYALIANGFLPPDNPDLGNFKYGNFTREGIRHPFQLKSAYSKKDLPFTNYTPGFTDMIDYIWYSTNTLQLAGHLGRLDERYLRRAPGFPDWHFVSDHVSLVAEFLVRPRKGGAGAPGGAGSEKSGGQGSARQSSAGSSMAGSAGAKGQGQDFGSNASEREREGTRSVTSRHS